MRIREIEKEVVLRGIVHWNRGVLQSEGRENAEQEIREQRGEHKPADIQPRRRPRCPQSHRNMSDAHRLTYFQR